MNGLHAGAALDRTRLASPVDPSSSSTYFPFPLPGSAAESSAFYPEALMAAVGRCSVDLGGVARPPEPCTLCPAAAEQTTHVDDDDDEDAMSALSCPGSDDDTASPGYTAASHPGYAAGSPGYTAASPSPGSSQDVETATVGLAVNNAASQRRAAADVEIIAS